MQGKIELGSAPIISDETSEQILLVSVIVPVFNRENQVLTTLLSIKNQIYRPIELIVIDDGSSDKSYDVVKCWSEINKEIDFTILLFTQVNSGAPVARNKGLNISNGKYIQFLDSDDSIHPKKIQNQMDALIRSKSDMAICDFQYVNAFNVVKKVVKNDGVLRKKLAIGWSIYTSTPLIKMTDYLKNITWDEGLRRNQDMDYLIKIFSCARSYSYTPGIWCNYVLHDGPQISDSYAITTPQYRRRISSLLNFLFLNRSKITYAGMLMVSINVLVLAKSWIFWNPKKYLKDFITAIRLRRNRK